VALIVVMRAGRTGEVTTTSAVSDTVPALLLAVKITA
jgi:hypothetical protein